METLETAADGLMVRGRPPFAMTPTSLLRNPTISSHAVRLWSVLASYTYGDQATDRPSRAQLAADIGWKSVRSVDTYLAELQETGYLTVQQRWRNYRGRARSLYILEWEPNNPTPAAVAEPTDRSIAAGQTQRKTLPLGPKPARSRSGTSRSAQVRPPRRKLPMGRQTADPLRRILHQPPRRILLR